MATNPYPYLKRYDILLSKEDGAASARIEERDDGPWVKYNDAWTLDNNIFSALNDIKILEKRVEELEKDIENHIDGRFRASEANVIIMGKYLKLKEKYEPSEP